MRIGTGARTHTLSRPPLTRVDHRQGVAVCGAGRDCVGGLDCVADGGVGAVRAVAAGGAARGGGLELLPGVLLCVLCDREVRGSGVPVRGGVVGGAVGGEEGAGRTGVRTGVRAAAGGCRFAPTGRRHVATGEAPPRSGQRNPWKTMRERVPPRQGRRNLRPIGAADYSTMYFVKRRTYGVSNCTFVISVSGIAAICGSHFPRASTVRKRIMSPTTSTGSPR